MAAAASSVQPLITAQNVKYRQDWDLGWDVTLTFPKINKTQDQRIVAVTVTLTDVETIEVEFDSPPASLTNILAEVLKRATRVQVA